MKGDFWVPDINLEITHICKVTPLNTSLLGRGLVWWLSRLNHCSSLMGTMVWVLPVCFWSSFPRSRSRGRRWPTSRVPEVKCCPWLWPAEAWSLGRRNRSLSCSPSFSLYAFPRKHKCIFVDNATFKHFRCAVQGHHCTYFAKQPSLLNICCTSFPKLKLNIHQTITSPSSLR